MSLGGQNALQLCERAYVRYFKENRRRVCVGVLRDALKSVINVKMVGTQIKALHGRHF